MNVRRRVRVRVIIPVLSHGRLDECNRWANTNKNTQNLQA
jgi:hypothetical protein